MRESVKISPEVFDRYIKQIASGDKSALAALYECARTSVYSYALSVLRTKSDADDVLQDTFLEIWRSAEKYQSRGKPMGWIITIARNFCLMRLRRAKLETAEPLEDYINDLGSSGGLGPEELTALRICLGELSEKEREIVILHAVAGLRHHEIAELLGLSLSAVLSRYNRSIRKLRKALQ